MRVLAERQARFPVIVISGWALEEEVRGCAGPNLNVTLLRKPFKPARLVEVVETALRTPSLE